MTKEWSAEDYELGALIQHAAAQPFVDALEFADDAHILDIGAGDGGFSIELAKRAPKGRLLAVDSSETMLALCREKTKPYPQIEVNKADAREIDFTDCFDLVCSFWCIQWIEDYPKVYEKIYQALHLGGKTLTIFPTGDDAMMTSFQAVRDSGEFKVLNDFIVPFHYSKFDSIEQRLATIPFRQLDIQKKSSKIKLSSLDDFYQFLKGVSFFYKGQVEEGEIDTLHRAQVKAFDEYCHLHYGGEYFFEFTCFVVSGEK